jgi:hypothetical protein
MRRYLSVPLIPFDLALFAKLQKWKLHIPCSAVFCFVFLGQNGHLFFFATTFKKLRRGCHRKTILWLVTLLDGSEINDNFISPADLR